MLKKLLFRFIIRRIKNADDDEMVQIVQAIQHRYSIRFPNWDVSFLSLSRDPAERKKQLDLLRDFLLNYDPREYEKTSGEMVSPLALFMKNQAFSRARVRVVRSQTSVGP